MSVKLDDYREQLEGIDPALHATLAANFTEATRVMSPAGLHNYLEGARALSQLGRGTDLITSYLESMPAVAKEASEDIIKDCVNAALKLASMVSGEIIGLLFATLPTAARRLGEAELLRGYLSLIHQLSAKVPRGLRPMLAHLAAGRCGARRPTAATSPRRRAISICKAPTALPCCRRNGAARCSWTISAN
jgi:nitric oxide reductase NorD protein